MITGALFELSGSVAVNSTWSEDIYFSENGSAMDISDLDWKMTFRQEEDQTSADITLSIDEGTLSIQQDDNGDSRILRITVAAGTLNSYSGDFYCDLASQDVNDVVTLWAHGVINLTQNPVVF